MRCFGSGENDCCNFYGHDGECLQACDNVGDNFNCSGKLEHILMFVCSLFSPQKMNPFTMSWSMMAVLYS